VERFDYANRRAYVTEVESDYFTDAQTDTEVRLLRLEERVCRERASSPVREPVSLPNGPDGLPPAPAPAPREGEGEDYSAWRGEVHVTTVATMYKKIRFYTRENVGAGDINLPPEELDTEAFVMTMSEDTAAELGLSGGNRGAAWRALGDLLRRVAPLFIRCQPSDLGLSSHVKSPHFGRPTLFLYDKVQGGVGLGELLFGAHRELLGAALDVATRCSCDSGCPACVGTAAEVGPLGKEIVLKLLEHLAHGAMPIATDPGDGEAPPIESMDVDADFGPLPRGAATEGL